MLYYEMFLNQPSQQNIRKTSTKEFCDGCFTTLVTISNTYIKQFSRNHLLKNSPINFLEDLKTKIENKNTENL